MKNLFKSLFNKSKTENIQIVDPKKILFSVPTLSDDIPALEPLGKKPSKKDFGFHEDDWCQIEFFPKNQLKTIQKILKEYKQFEHMHRVQQGWTDVYVRKIERTPVLPSIQKLEKLLVLKAGEAPFLFASRAMPGKVKNGFTIPLGGNIVIYGYVNKGNIFTLGANVGKDPDDTRLTDAFVKLNKSDGLLLVDWQAQLLVVEASSASNVEVWRP